MRFHFPIENPRNILLYLAHRPSPTRLALPEQLHRFPISQERDLPGP